MCLRSWGRRCARSEGLQRDSSSKRRGKQHAGAQSVPGGVLACIPSSGMRHGSVLLETSLTVPLQLSHCLGVPEEWRVSHYPEDREFESAGDVKEDFECRAQGTDSHPSICPSFQLPANEGSRNKPLQASGKERKMLKAHEGLTRSQAWFSEIVKKSLLTNCLRRERKI